MVFRTDRLYHSIDVMRKRLPGIQAQLQNNDIPARIQAEYPAAPVLFLFLSAHHSQMGHTSQP
jgi:hypothetical protein